MAWWEQLDNTRGSRPRCVLLVDGNREEVADRLTRLVNLPSVVVSSDDCWMPYGKPVRENGSWDTEPATEARLGRQNSLVCGDIQQQLRNWWLATSRGANMPNWDIASTCKIEGKPGLLLVEAKAHGCELWESMKCGSTNPDNLEQIMQAIIQARTGLQSVVGGNWDISRDRHYQLSNRFAWSWKLVSLGIPVVLLYLGFSKAEDMLDRGPIFHSKIDWERTVKDHCHGIVPETCWEKRWDFGGVPFYPIIRAYDQTFYPTK